MKLFTKDTEYNKTIKDALSIIGNYNGNVIFHCFWNGQLNEKHLISIKSCYYFNLFNKTNRKIILWLENNYENKFNDEIKKYAEIKHFCLSTELKNTFMEEKTYYYNKELSYYSDLVRYILLYKYGGCWFDLDVLFLKNMDGLFYHYENEIIVYQWERQNYPNGAIYISLIPNSEKMKKNIEFIIQKNAGWGFQEAKLTYDCQIDLFVLPCSWFDAGWIQNPCHYGFNIFKTTNQIYTFDNFFNGAFCFHWHNQWNSPIEKNSIIDQLYQIINQNMNESN
jgi:hypothetical protein